MDRDLWSPSFDQVAEENSYSMQPGWQCDFNFGYGVDVIEEDALNEKHCTEVLRILITKADTEIDELEKDLISIQNELAWAEYKEWPDLCCNTLREKIDCLDISIRSLKNKDGHGIDVPLLMQRKAAEKIYDILNALLRNYFQEKDEQYPDAIVKILNSNSVRYAADLLDENKKLGNIDSNIITKEEVKEPSITLPDKSSILNKSSELQETTTSHLETTKPSNTNVKDSSPDFLKLAAGHSAEDKIQSNFGSKSTTEGETKESSFTPEAKRAIQNSSLKSAEERKQSVEAARPEDTVENNSSTDALKQEIGPSNENKKMGNSDSDGMDEKAESIHTSDDPIVDASLKPEAKKTVLYLHQPVNRVIKDSISDARPATGCSNELKKLRKSSLKVNVNAKEEFREQGSTPTDKSKILNSCLNLEGKANLDKPPNAIVKDIGKDAGKDAFRKATGHNWRKSSDPILDEKLMKFALKIVQNDLIKELKDAPVNKIDSSISILKTEGNGKIPPKVVKAEEVGLTDTEQSALTSLLDLQDQWGNGMMKPQLKAEGKPRLEGGQNSEIAANDKFNLKLFLKPQRQKEKRKIKSNKMSIQEPHSPSMEICLDSSSVSKAKRQRKSGIRNGNAHLNQSLHEKISKQSAQPVKSEIEGQCATPVVRTDQSLQVQKKKKRNSNLPILVRIMGSGVRADISNLHAEAPRSASKDLQVPESCSSKGSCTEAVTSLPSTKLELESLTLVDLKAIAKQKKLPSYSRLKKKELVEQLANRLGFH